LFEQALAALNIDDIIRRKRATEATVSTAWHINRPAADDKGCDSGSSSDEEDLQALACKLEERRKERHCHQVHEQASIDESPSDPSPSKILSDDDLLTAVFSNPDLFT
jgi:hypothetical protein